MGANSSFLSACKPRWVLLDIAVTACLANICNAVYNTQCRRRQKPRGICTAGRESGRLLQTKAVNIDSTSSTTTAVRRRRPAGLVERDATAVSVMGQTLLAHL